MKGGAGLFEKKNQHYITIRREKNLGEEHTVGVNKGRTTGRTSRET